MWQLRQRSLGFAPQRVDAVDFGLQRIQSFRGQHRQRLGSGIGIGGAGAVRLFAHIGLGARRQAQSLQQRLVLGLHAVALGGTLGQVAAARRDGEAADAVDGQRGRRRQQALALAGERLVAQGDGHPRLQFEADARGQRRQLDVELAQPFVLVAQQLQIGRRQGQRLRLAPQRSCAFGLGPRAQQQGAAVAGAAARSIGLPVQMHARFLLARQRQRGGGGLGLRLGLGQCACGGGFGSLRRRQRLACAVTRGGATDQLGRLLLGGCQLLAQQPRQVLGALHRGGLRGALGVQRLGLAQRGLGLRQLAAQGGPGGGTIVGLVLLAQRAQLVDLVAVVARGGCQRLGLGA